MPTDPNAPLEAFQQRLDADSQFETQLFRTDTISVPGMDSHMTAELGVCGSGLYHTEAAPSLDELDGLDPDSFE